MSVGVIEGATSNLGSVKAKIRLPDYVKTTLIDRWTRGCAVGEIGIFPVVNKYVAERGSHRPPERPTMTVALRKAITCVQGRNLVKQ